jgi:RNA polymerase-binding transcription factor DksA
MAKTSKKTAPKKAAKPASKPKPTSKAKPVKAKPVKPKAAKPKKAAPKAQAIKKPLPPKKAVKKVEVKPVASKAVDKAASTKAIAKAKKEEVAPVSKKPFEPANANMQLNIFPIVNQRPIAHKPAKAAVVNEDKTRYSDNELKEFETLIIKKMNKAKDEFKILKDTLNRTNDEGTDSTSGGNTKVLEDGAETAEKENLSQLAARQLKFITNLENALVRIKNRTYGICSVTGKLISKERLYAVPHTTQSIEAKMMKKD